MVTVKFEAEKLDSEFVILPAILVNTNNKKNCFGISLGWFKRVLTISINWSRKAMKAQAQYQKYSC